MTQNNDEAFHKIMAQVQVYASSYALVGTRFATNNQLEEADREKLALYNMVKSALSQSPISQNEHQEASLKVYHGEICYKSHADDQSYGMWCPVGYDTTQMYREGTEFYTSPPKQIPDGWISVKDRLPEKYTEVLVYPQPNEYSHCASYGKFKNKQIDDGWFYGEYESGIGHENYACKVTHWMPLPPSPTNTEVEE